MEWFFWAIAVVSTGLAIILLEVAKVIWWKPLHFKKLFEAQGIQGPSYNFIYGNAPDIVRMARQESSNTKSLSGHNIVPRVLPAFHQWRKTYGQKYIYWFGNKPRLYVPDPELVREILSNKFGHYKKLQGNPTPKEHRGLVTLEGEKWAQHRRVINPSFHMEVLKGMIPEIAECGTNMIEEWKTLVSSGANEINVLKEFSCLTSDVISRTAFGSSYAEGKHLFHLLSELILLRFEKSRRVFIPGSRFLPTKKNMQDWSLTKKVRNCARQVIESRERTVGLGKSVNYGTDLLGQMMSSNKKQGGKVQSNIHMTTDEIISECLTFYTAGQETTTILLTWTMILLGMHQDWQELARKEVLEVCGKNDFPTADTVNSLKIMGMIFNESMRLYPPIVTLFRQTEKPMKLGRLTIPAGTQLQIPILAMHHDPSVWGDNVYEFNPERFREGISKAAKHPNAFMPFSLGPRVCIGQNFAILEAKVVLAMILQRFSFVISPNYIHAPVHSLSLKPQFGAQVILHMN
ncbi:cytochrome P450 CYP72A616 [Cryptomeria japonica]|uniref:cytochrome P450 CYP72A616 n=1 Tax=Cryptomeria japonica TaxID=3369 RepID=UPI0027DA5B92|nr:cytochrome P450 CYP72A616 [Cryptomeria japonica]